MICLSSMSMGVVFYREMFSTTNFVILVCIFHLLSKSLICRIVWKVLCEMTCDFPGRAIIWLMSSAYCMQSVSGSGGWMFRTYKFNSVGERQAPCGTPVSRLKVGHV